MRKYFLFVLVLLLAVAAAVPALADASVTVSGGTIETSAPDLTFDAVALNGQNNTTYANDDETVLWMGNDPTGTGDGWTYAIKAQDFVSGEGQTIAVDGLQAKVNQVSVVAGAGVVSPVPSTQMSGYTQLSDESFVNMLRAEEDEGMGKYTFAPQLQLLVPASTYAGQYTSDIEVLMQPLVP